MRLHCHTDFLGGLSHLRKGYSERDPVQRGLTCVTVRTQEWISVAGRKRNMQQSEAPCVCVCVCVSHLGLLYRLLDPLNNSGVEHLQVT